MKIEKTSIISSDTNFEGKIYSPCSIEIEGNVVGEVISKESIAISRFGKINGNIKTKDAKIEGQLNGNLIASGKVEITSTGVLIGNMILKNLDFILETNGVFKGSCINVENEEIFEIKKGECLKDLKINLKK